MICRAQFFLISNHFWTRSKHLLLIYVVVDVSKWRLWRWEGQRSFGRSGQHIWWTIPLVQCARATEGREVEEVVMEIWTYCWYVYSKDDGKPGPHWLRVKLEYITGPAAVLHSSVLSFEITLLSTGQIKQMEVSFLSRSLIGIVRAIAAIGYVSCIPLTWKFQNIVMRDIHRPHTLQHIIIVP